MPLVSIIIPCYNEEATIRLLLEAIYRQTYPRSEIEVIIADGMSTDRTREEVAQFQEMYPDLNIKIVDNSKRIIPAALNAALAVAQGQYVVRLDAHSVPAPDYVERCVANLEEHKGENVGGVWDIRPGSSSWIARSIAAAAAHPLGVGDARYRYTAEAGFVDTVPFGAFRRDLVERIGWFDETLLTNEDYEFNTRLRNSGGRIWLDPSIRAIYFARPDLKTLALQYGRYGYWKWKMLRRYPGSLRWRQALPPLFVLSLIGWILLSLFWRPAVYGLLIEIAGYFLVLWVTSISAAFSRRDYSLIAGMPLAIATMHFSWGIGFLRSLFG